MRHVLLALAAITAVSCSPAIARDYQWCQRTSVTGGNPQCSFTSYRQCKASISGVGGDCIRNPSLAYGGRSRRY
jgi:hypothetical protein